MLPYIPFKLPKHGEVHTMEREQDRYSSYLMIAQEMSQQ